MRFTGRTQSNCAFGLGLGRIRSERLPVGPSASDEAWLAAHMRRPTTAPTEAEHRAFIESRTMTAAEFHARVENQAREARGMDLICRGIIFA